MRIEVLHNDATAVEGDVLALKYAQARYGLDAYVAQCLRGAGYTDDEMSPVPGSFCLLPAVAGVEARNILFVGVETLWKFEYQQIRTFARIALSSLARELPNAKRLVVTVHGPGYGLDEDEAFQSQVAGFLDAIGDCDVPAHFEVITFVERNEGRATRLQQVLEQIMPGGRVRGGQDGASDGRKPDASGRLRDVGYASGSKDHVFVAMPFSEDMEDVYHYGIRNAVKGTGLLCERADLSAYTGDVVTWVRERIKTSSLVVADLTSANPNVYLEVGFAWGCGVPTVLLSRNSGELRFDVRGQRCLIYSTIRDLEEKLQVELSALDSKVSVQQ